ncbi:MAG: insulinase family protein [Clostridia bacterium]|nr:insulinase family protein [Clostridia bacterium]
MDERLDWMDKNYLSAFDAIEPHSEISRQAHIGSREPIRVTEKYSVGTNDDTEGKDYLAFSVMGGSNLDVLECRAWSVLSNVLLNSDSAPVKKALRDAGIGEDVYGGYDSHAIEDSFSVVAKNAKAEDIDRFYAIIMDTLQKQIEDGVNEKALLACINRREFRFREADYGGYPRGLDYAADMLQSWLYDDSAAFSYMHVLDDYAKLKELIGTGYYENLIKKVIFDTDHAVLITMVPERGMIDRKNEELKEKLAAYKASLSAQEIDAIVKATEELRAYQSREATEEELNCIPSLKRSDIPRETVPYFNEERTVGGVKTIYHEVETNGITYANIYFDMDKIPQKYVPYLNILSALLARIDTAKHTYEELDVDMRLNVGSLGFGLSTFRKYKSREEYRLMYGIYTRALADQLDYAMETALEIASSSKFSDTARIKTILAEMKNDKKNEIMNNGNSVAAARARSYFSKIDCFFQQLSGIDFYFFLSDLLDNWDARAAEVTENLTKLAAYIFNPDNMIMSLACDEAGYKAVEAALPKLTAGLAAYAHDSLGEAEEYVPVKKNEGIQVPSQVQYVARVGNLGFDGLEYNGTFQVVKTAVNIDWLYQQVRVKGGAYGVGCGFGGDSGNVQFTSYRDPKLTETDAAYLGTADFVRNHKFDEAELTKYIVGTFSGYERPMSNSHKAHRSFEAYITGKTYEDVLRERSEMLDITEEQFRASAEMFDKICAQGYICTVGNETKLSENADMFDNLVTIK